MMVPLLNTKLIHFILYAAKIKELFGSGNRLQINSRFIVLIKPLTLYNYIWNIKTIH